MSSAGLALAETDGKSGSLSGRVQAGEVIAVKAPFGGQLMDFTLRAGDVVKAGDGLFQVETAKVYAPADGTVRGVKAQPGDDAAYVISRYGMLMEMEPESLYQVQSSVAGAYDKDETRIVHSGETVYLKSVNSPKRQGVGFVTGVEGKVFAVEVTQSDLELDEYVTIHREADCGNECRLGRGRTARMSALPMTGEGGVVRVCVKVCVKEGDIVNRGDVLLEMGAGTLLGQSSISDAVQADRASVVASVEVTPGMAVSERQVLGVLYPLDSYRVAADINEMDLPFVTAGDAVELEMESMGQDQTLPGTVTAISALNKASQGDTEYTVYISFDAMQDVREGMSVTVRLQ